MQGQQAIEKRIDRSNPEVILPVFQPPESGAKGAFDILDGCGFGPGWLHRVRAEGTFLCATPLGPGGEQIKFHFIFVLKGQVALSCWNVSSPAPAGSIFGRTDLETFSIRTDGEAELLVMTFPVWFAVREMLDAENFLGDAFIPADFIASDAITGLVLKVVEQDPPLHAVEVALQTVSAMLRIGLAACRAVNVPPSVRRTGRMPRLLMSMARHLADDDFSPAQAARDLRCSVRTVHNLFAENGMTFGNLLLEWRLRLAADMLLRGDQRISEIAYQAGFTSFSHFCRAFKAQFGVSAGRYRAIH